MKCIAALFAALSLMLAPAAITGCKATPNQIAYKSGKAVVESVDIAMRGWADYVIGERARIAILAPEDRVEPTQVLLRKEGRVINAYGAYQKAMFKNSQLDWSKELYESLPAASANAAAAVLDAIKQESPTWKPLP